ncbi:MAG: 1-acyl-sn-glycerol-3-phosphate acyltransferase [Bacteroidaceae bacterium]|nr:1-acyl-sn-glycerol-3-phosphate acyltransferase [Bacteroidaceae bacterium]
MGKRRKIQENDWRYDVLHWLVDRTTKVSYRRLRYIGTERIPKDGAVIYAPNHTGTLMDALIVLAMSHEPTVFIARADIFKNPKLAKMFRFFKMAPIMRMRDGIEEVKKNNKTIEMAADVLKDRIPLCIFPEGKHQTKYSLQPLSKGIFRIALQAKEQLGDTPLYIVPMGIRYGNFFRFRSTVTLQVGNPINVGEFIAKNEDKTPQELMNLMRGCLDERMKETILYIPNDEEYDAKNEICAAVSDKLLKKHESVGNAPLVTANQEAARRIEEMKSEKPEAAARLIASADEAVKMRRKMGISLKSVTGQPKMLSIILKSLLLLVTLPYTLATMILTLPIIAIGNMLTKKFKDRAFHNSVRYVLHLVLWPLLLIIYTAIAFATMPPLWAACAVAAALPAPAVAQETFRAARLIVSDFRLLRCKPLMAKYNEIRNLFFN